MDSLLCKQTSSHLLHPLGNIAKWLVWQSQQCRVVGPDIFFFFSSYLEQGKMFSHNRIGKHIQTVWMENATDSETPTVLTEPWLWNTKHLPRMPDCCCGFNCGYRWPHNTLGAWAMLWDVAQSKFVAGEPMWLWNWILLVCFDGNQCAGSQSDSVTNPLPPSSLHLTLISPPIHSPPSLLCHTHIHTHKSFLSRVCQQLKAFHFLLLQMWPLEYFQWLWPWRKLQKIQRR